MKRRIILGCLLVVGCVVAIIGVMHGKMKKTYASAENFDSSINMQFSLESIQYYLKSEYSSSKSSKYVGNATVKKTYDSFGVIGENMNQTLLNNEWNRVNKDKTVGGTCGVVASTMLIRKYISQNKLPMGQTNQQIFNSLVEYAWKSKIYTSTNNGSTTPLEQKKILNKYLDDKGSKYTANADVMNLWSTSKNYLDDKIEPIVVGLNGYSGGHAVLATDAYILNVKYKTKLVSGIYINHSKNYKVLRICNGWEDTNLKNFNDSTYRYIYFDCVDDLVKLK